MSILTSNNVPSLLKTQHYPSVIEIETWIASYIADLLEMEADAIDITVPFDRYGLDSSAAIGLTGDLEEWLGIELDPTLLYDYPTIKDLAQNLVAEAQN